MEIKKSKKSNLTYATLGAFIILLVFIKSDSDQSLNNNLLTIFTLFFGVICGLFIFKAYDKRPLYIIDDKKVFIRKDNLLYEFKDLSFYRCETLGSRYGRFDYIYFYNSDNLIVFKINVSVTDHNVKQIRNKLDKHLKEKKG